jgi:hypothetical protein
MDKTRDYAVEGSSETQPEQGLGEVFSDMSVGDSPLDLETYWICVGLEDW